MSLSSIPLNQQQNSKALNYTLEVMFTLLRCGGPSITALGPLKRLDLTGGYGGDSGEEDENFPSFKELLLSAGGAQESQRMGLRLGGD